MDDSEGMVFVTDGDTGQSYGYTKFWWNVAWGMCFLMGVISGVLIGTWF